MGTRSGVINMTSDSDYVKLAEDDWKEEKKDKNTGDIVESRKNSAGRKIYRCKASIGMPAKLLIEAISNTDKVCEWNKTLTEARVLKTINKDCVISYQVTSDGGGGMVSARDFVYVSKKGYDGDTFVMGGQSVEFQDAPAKEDCESSQWAGLSDGDSLGQSALSLPLADGLRLQGLDASKYSGCSNASGSNSTPRKYPQTR